MCEKKSRVCICVFEEKNSCTCIRHLKPPTPILSAQSNSATPGADVLVYLRPPPPSLLLLPYPLIPLRLVPGQARSWGISWIHSRRRQSNVTTSTGPKDAVGEFKSLCVCACVMCREESQVMPGVGRGARPPRDF